MKLPFDIKSLFETNRIASIEVFTDPNQHRYYNLVILEKKAKKIHIRSKKGHIHSIKELGELLTKHIPIILTLNGKGVLTKKVAHEDDDHEEDIIRRVLPNARVQDFYTQQINPEEGYLIVSIARKEIVEDILKEFDQIKVFILDVLFGFGCMPCITELLSIESGKLTIDHSRLTFKNGIIVDFSTNKYKKKEVIYHLGEEDVEEGLIVAFASGYDFLVNRKNNIDDVLVEHQRDEYRYFKIFKKGGMGILIVCFISLLINFLVFDSMNKRANELSVEVSSYDALLNRHSKLKEDLGKKEDIIQMLGLASQSKVSFIADRIAGTIPEGIQLSELEIFKQSNKRKEGFVFDRRQIVISGWSKSSLIVNDWIKKIKELEWVEDVDVADYVWEEKEGRGAFEVVAGLTVEDG